MSDLWAVWGSSASDIWLCGDGATLVHYDGAQWSLVTAATSADLFGISGTSSTDVYIVGDSGTILHYR
jgi:hypothetical protein